MARSKRQTVREHAKANSPATQLPYLETFVKVAELNSITKVARHLGLTQATVSHRIQTLERKLRVPLFRREKGRIFLSAQGEKLYPFATQILALYTDAIAAITGKFVDVRGVLCVGTNSIPAEQLIPIVLSRFRELHPGLRLQILVYPSRVLLERLESGQLDLALIGMRTDNPNLEFTPFADDELVAVVSSKHPWAKKGRISLAELLSQPLIVREEGSGSRSCLEHALSRHGQSVGDLNVIAEFASNEGIKHALQENIGVAILSRRVIREEIKRGKLREVVIRDLDMRRKLYIARDKRRAMSLPQQYFLECLKAALP